MCRGETFATSRLLWSSWCWPKCRKKILDREGSRPTQAPCGVPAYVWGSQDALVLQQRCELGWFGIECVDGVGGERSVVERCEHRVVVHERRPGGIDQDGSAGDDGHAASVEQRASVGRWRRMQANNVGRCEQLG